MKGNVRDRLFWEWFSWKTRKGCAFVPGIVFIAWEGERGNRIVVGRGMTFDLEWSPSYFPVVPPGKGRGASGVRGPAKGLCWPPLGSVSWARLCYHLWYSYPLQCSCLENPRDGEAWWAAVYGVAQSWTRLKRLSSSSIVQFQESTDRNPECCLYPHMIPARWLTTV